MPEFTTPIVLRSPLERGPRVKDAQYTLNGHNFYGVAWLKGSVDGAWGLESAQAADAARRALGYPEELCHTGVFGQQLFNYLRTDGSRVKLPPTYLLRRIARLRAKASIKAHALEIAISHIGITENPAGSNRNPFGKWYGLDGEPWCAIHVTNCFVAAGDKEVFARGRRTAWAYWAENMARAGLYGLRITSNPEPGDIVVYHYHDGHTGIFEGWTDRAGGAFTAIEGNTSANSDDNGGAVERRHRTLAWCRTVFVRFPS